MTDEHAQRVIAALIKMKRDNMNAMNEMMKNVGEVMKLDPKDSDIEVLQALTLAEQALLAKMPGPSETRPKRRRFQFRPKPKKV